METSRLLLKIQLIVLALHLCVAALSFTPCDARRSMHLVGGGSRNRRVRGSSSSITKPTKKLLQVSKYLDLIGAQLEASNTAPYGVSSPFSLPPYDSLPPIPLPDYAPPFCVYPPFTPQPPSTTIPTFPPPATGGGGNPPSLPLPPPPPSSSTTPTQIPPPSPAGGGTIPSPPQSIPSYPPNPPEILPRPPAPPASVPSPTTVVPSPTQPTLSPPLSNVPTTYSPPSIFVPSPPVFQPPVVFPPPAVPPPPRRVPYSALWCVAKPTVPDPIIEEAMNYACGSGGDCESILPNGSCFQPDTLFAHASYAFNSYWQRTKVAGGTCEFGGTAMLVTVDPSYDGCHFVYY